MCTGKTIFKLRVPSFNMFFQIILVLICTSIFGVRNCNFCVLNSRFAISCSRRLHLCTPSLKKDLSSMWEKPARRSSMRNPSAVSWTQTTGYLLDTKSLCWAFISQALSEPPNSAIAREITLSWDEISGLGRVELEPPPKHLQQLQEKQYSCCLFLGMVGTNFVRYCQVCKSRFIR